MQIWISIEFSINQLLKGYRIDLNRCEKIDSKELQSLINNYFELCLEILSLSLNLKFIKISEKYLKFLQIKRNLAPEVTSKDYFRKKFRELMNIYESQINKNDSNVFDGKKQKETVEKISKTLTGFFGGIVKQISDTKDIDTDKDNCKYDSGGNLHYNPELGRWVIDGEVPVDSDEEKEEEKQAKSQVPKKIPPKLPPSSIKRSSQNKESNGAKGRARPKRRFVSFMKNN